MDFYAISAKIRSRKFLIPLLFIILVILVVNYLISNSRLEIENSSSDNVVVFIDGNEHQEKIELKPKEKISRSLARSSYSVSVASGAKQSKYSVDLGFLWQKTKLSLELFEPKSGALLGKSQLRCGREINNTPVFYSCAPSSNGLIESSDQIALSPSLSEQTSETPEIAENKSTISMKPFANVFVEAKLADSKLYIAKRGISGYVKDPKIVIDNFGSVLSDQLFSIDETQGKYAVVDKQNNKIIYGSLGSQDQKTIDLSNKKITAAQANISVSVGGNTIYLAILPEEEDLEGNKDDEADIKPQIIAFDINSGERINSINLANKSSATTFTASSGGLLYSIPNILPENGGGINLIGGEFKITDLSGLDINSTRFCWQDAKNFYYQGFGNSIYKYSLDKKAAYLVYQNNSSEDFITELSCADNNIYFSIDSKLDEELGSFYHYKLSDTLRDGTPIEEVLPKFFEVDDNTYKASLLTGSKVKVELIYARDKPSSESKIKSVLLDALGFEDVEVSSLKIIYIN